MKRISESTQILLNQTIFYEIERTNYLYEKIKSTRNGRQMLTFPLNVYV